MRGGGGARAVVGCGGYNARWSGAARRRCSRGDSGTRGSSGCSGDCEDRRARRRGRAAATATKGGGDKKICQHLPCFSFVLATVFVWIGNGEGRAVRALYTQQALVAGRGLARD